MAAFLEDEERPLRCVAADQIEDHIDLLLQSCLELRVAVIKDSSGTEGVEVGFVVAACRSDDGGAGLRCQLHGIGTYSARTTMDQDGLSLLQLSVGEESLPRSLGGHRHGCRLFERKIRWLLCDQRRLDSEMLRVRGARFVGTEHCIP